MSLTPLPLIVRPVQFETPWWYLGRLCRANAVDPQFVAGLVNRRHHLTGPRSHLTEVIADLGGPRAHHWENSHARASLGMTWPRGPFVRQRATRTACMSCTAGEVVATFDHIQFGFCLKHGRWVGRGSDATQQRLAFVDAETYRAERLTRRLMATRRVNEELHDLAWHVTRDTVYLSGQWPDRLRRAHSQPQFVREVDDRIALYPQTVRLLEAICGAGFLALVPATRSNTAEGRAYLNQALGWMTDERPLAIEALETWSRERRRHEDRLAAG